MPSLVGGFGNENLYVFNFKNKRSFLSVNNYSTINIQDDPNYQNKLNSKIDSPSQLGPYLAGLIEGDGTFAIHDKNSIVKKYTPKILIVFKKADLPLVKYLQNITESGNIYIKSDRGYVLWQIQDMTGVFNIVNIING